MMFCILLNFFPANKRHANDTAFRKFHHQLFHSLLAHIFQPLKPGMTKPEIVHYRLAIYSIGPYIANYPEQALLTCIIQGWCPKSILLLLFIVL